MRAGRLDPAQSHQAVAARSGWQVDEVYEDAGISGAKGRHKRPGLDAMLKAVNARVSVAVTVAVSCKVGCEPCCGAACRQPRRPSSRALVAASSAVLSRSAVGGGGTS